MNNLLLIKTTADFDIKNHLNGPPLGLMCLGAFTKKFSPIKYHMDLIDMRLPKMSFTEMKKYIWRLKHDLIGCSVMTIEHRWMHELAKLAKDIDNKIKIIVGGPHLISFGYIGDTVDYDYMKGGKYL